MYKCMYICMYVYMYTCIVLAFLGVYSDKACPRVQHRSSYE